MDSGTKLFNPQFSLLFITLPQALLAVFFFYAYQSAGIMPTLPLMIIFGIQAAFNIYIAIDALRYFRNGAPAQPCSPGPLLYGHKTPPLSGPLLSNIIRLIGFIAIISAAIPFLLKQFSFESAISPETIYAVLCLIPLVYMMTDTLRRKEIPLPRIGVRIAICAGFPFLISAISFLIVGLSTASYSLIDSAAGIILNVFFVLFLVFVFLIISILYHFRTKAPSRPEDVKIAVLEDGTVYKKRSAGYNVFLVVFALFLPVFCLYFNNEITSKLLGDFSGLWFYILAIVNGVSMLVPQKGKWVTLAALFFKSIGFLYIFYLTVALLKYIPIVFVLSFTWISLLALAPAVLFAAELLQIVDDFKYLKQHFSIQSVVSVFICGMLFLCAGLVGNCYVHKVNFDNAMCYLNEDEPVYPSVNIPMLKTTLEYAQPQSQSNFIGIFTVSRGAPLLSEIYRGIVLNNKVLSPDSYTNLSRIFLPYEAASRLRSPSPDTLATIEKSVKILEIKTETEHDSQNGLYKTWIHLQMKNETEANNQEFSVRFILPDGVFISDYYLDVKGERKYGIVSEKQSAQMTYDNIVSRSRDPGIIYYEQGNIIELKVFPFSSSESRTAGFLVMYPQSETINIGGNTIELEGEDLAAPIIAGDVCFMPASYKETLTPEAERMPKYYFIADAGRLGAGLGRITSQITGYAERAGIVDADVYLTGYNVKKADLEYLELYPDMAEYSEGGFNMALAMGMIYKDVKQYPGCYPVILVASENIYKAAVSDNRRFVHDFPESEYYYLINDDGSLTPIRFADNTETMTTDKPIYTGVLLYDGFYFKDNGLSEVSYKSERGFSDIFFSDNLYINALLLGEKIEKARTNEEIIETVKDAFSQRVLTENVSFIVLETKEQEEELLRRNRDFLNGKVVSASHASMDEPGLADAVLLTALLLAAMHARRRYKRNVA